MIEKIVDEVWPIFTIYKIIANNFFEFHENIFLKCCQQGHLEIIKYIYEKIIHPSSLEFAQLYFEISCENKHVQMAKWFYEKFNIVKNSKVSFV